LTLIHLWVIVNGTSTLAFDDISSRVSAVRAA